MPFDVRELPVRGPDPDAADRRNRRWVAVWLGVISAMILGMIVLGGATRLTGSGLSIMEWAPLSGALPPLSNQEWQRLFLLYKQIPQYSLINSEFTLADFQHIFWLEWLHRLWGRLIGLVFFVPFVWLAARGMIGRKMLARLGLLFVLGGLQGAVGWFMVASGFLPDSTAVSPYRLVAHLVLALALYGALIWTALSTWPAQPRTPGPRGIRWMAGIAVAAVALTIIAGGFVAGLHAGLDYNTFPLMDGRLVPDGYAKLIPFPRNLTENIAAVQFDHRLLATLTAVAALLTVGHGLNSRLRGPGRPALVALGVTVLAQYALGVATLLNVVPVGLAVAHQFVAVLVLTAALATLHALRGRVAR